jgi:zinc protease
MRAEGDPDRVRDVMLETIADLEANPITEDEVDRIRNQYMASIEQLMNNSQAVALQLSDWESMGDWRMLFYDRDRLRAVTAEQAQAAALHYFKESNRTVGIFRPDPAPERTTIPAPPDLDSLLTDYSGDEGRSLGEAFDPSPANIESRTVRRTLPGGIELAMLSKETRGDQVNATIRLHVGNVDNLNGKDRTASFTGSMLMRGTRSRSRQDIEDEIARLQSSLNVGGGAGTFSATMRSTRENLPAVMALAFEILREPAFPENEFRTLKENALASIEASRSEPDSIVSRELSRFYRQQYQRGDPRYQPTLEESIEDIEAVELADLREFHEQFVGASVAHVSVVGDFDPAQFESAVVEALAGWESGMPYAQIVTNYPEPALTPINESFITPDKENAIFIAFQPVRMNDEHDDYPAMVLGTYILGDGVGSRLFARIRGEEGLSYGVSAGFSAPTLGDGAQFTAQAIAAPENVAQVEASFLDELGIILRDGYSDDEVAAAQRSWTQNRQVSRAQDGTVTSMLVTDLHYDRTMEWDAELEAKVQALTAADIRAAMNRHLGLDGLTIMKGGDFAQ